MDTLIENYSLSVSHVMEGLQSLPRDTDGAYKHVVERIENQNPVQASLAKKVLSYVVCARRPLLARELREALTVEPGMKTLDHDRLVDNETWVSVCAGLVQVNAKSHVVRLVRELHSMNLTGRVSYLLWQMPLRSRTWKPTRMLCSRMLIRSWQRSASRTCRWTISVMSKRNICTSFSTSSNNMISWTMRPFTGDLTPESLVPNLLGGSY
jgi:hypothetical protein